MKILYLAWWLVKALWHLSRAALTVLLIVRPPTSHWSVRRFVFSGACLFALSGWCRQQVGYFEFIERLLTEARVDLRWLLAFVLKMPSLIDFLTGRFLDVLLIFLLAFFLIRWMIRLPSFLNKIVVLTVVARLGLQLTCHLQLIALLTLPVLCAFAIAWEGNASLAAWAYCLGVMALLHKSNHEHLEHTLAAYVAAQRTMGGINVAGDN